VARNITVTRSTAGATIHYTLNGQEPLESDPIGADKMIILAQSPSSPAS
jgi:hypothetical protein